ncbi:MAG: cytochrome c biogenesis protein CcdA [Kiritimatiellae bacterium]|nr:cytochrome c biogenesis protein CcdA [Kiritimatiellia bacterium]
MLERLFTSLSGAVRGSPVPALMAAGVWGVLSVLLSPCHLASIPLVVGYLGRQGAVGTRRAFAISLSFALGILVTIVLVGVVTAAAGRMLGDLGGWGNWLVAAIFLVIGLALLDVIPLPAPAMSAGKGRRGLGGALLLGLAFGVALGPCTFAFLAPMLAVALQTARLRPAYGALLLLAYGIGHCAVIAAAGIGFGWVERVLAWNRDSSASQVVRRVCGALVILAALWLIYTAP